VDTNPIEFNWRSYLRNEWFWAAIVAIAVITGILQDAGRLEEQSQEDASQQVRAVDQKMLWRASFQTEGRLYQRRLNEALPHLTIRLLNLALLFAGAAILAVLLIVRIQRPLMRPVLARPALWGLWDVMKVAALYVLGVVVFAWIFRPNPAAPLMDNRGWFMEIFTRLLVIGAILNVVVGERDGRWADLGFRGKIWRNLLIGAVACVALQPILALIYAAMFSLLPEVPLQASLQTLLESHSGSLLGLAAFTAILLVPLSEELLFRAYLQPALERWFGGAISVLLTAALFAAAHRDFYVFLPTFVLGLTLGYLYNRTRSLAAPLCLHVLFNALAILQVLTVRS